MKNFPEYNKKVAEDLKKDELTASDLERIHEFTYTIEIALAKINDSLGSMPQTLERLHLSLLNAQRGPTEISATNHSRMAGR